MSALLFVWVLSKIRMLPAGIGVVFIMSSAAYAQQDTIQQQYSVQYLNSGIDSLPSFNPDEEVLWKYIADNFRYNRQFYNETGTGWNRILCELEIDSLGDAKPLLIENNVPGQNVNTGNLAEKEFNRIFSSMPRWKPAFSNGHAVSFTLYLAMEYRLTDSGIEIKHGGIQASKGTSHSKTVNNAKKIITITAIVVMVWFVVQLLSHKL